MEGLLSTGPTPSSLFVGLKKIFPFLMLFQKTDLLTFFKIQNICPLTKGCSNANINVSIPPKHLIGSLYPLKGPKIPDLQQVTLPKFIFSYSRIMGVYKFLDKPC